MKKFLLVALYEYRQHVFRKRFLWTSLGLPLMMLFFIMIALFISWLQRDDRPLAYVDQSGLLTYPVALSEPSRNEMLLYETEAKAEAALLAEEVQGYYLLPADYLQSGDVELFYLDKEPKDSVQEQFEALVRANLFKDKPLAISTRIDEGIESLQIKFPDGSQQYVSALLLKILMPLIASLILITTIFTSSGYLMQAIVSEKENRTMEMLVTSLSPGQLITGKVLGITAISLTQIFGWLILALALLLIMINSYDWMEYVKLDSTLILLLVLTMLPAYVMIAALMMAVGSTVVESSEGQQITSLFTWPVMISYWFTLPILLTPNGRLAVGLSLFPLTAPVTLTLRSSVTTIPTWQIVLSVGLLFLSASAAIWLAARAFHLGMLRYGQPLQWSEVFRGTKR